MATTSYKMRQCTFTRKTGNGLVGMYTAWIPAIKAIIGRTVKIKDHGEWVVLDVGSEMDSEDVVANSVDYRRHRKATDI